MKEVHVSVEFVRNHKFRQYLDFSKEFLTIKEKKKEKSVSDILLL